MAKAALNQQNETIAQAFKDSPDPMIFLAPEPGYAPTRLTGWKEKMTFTRLSEE